MRTRRYIPKKNRNFSSHMTEVYYGGSKFYLCKLCSFARKDATQVIILFWS